MDKKGHHINLQLSEETWGILQQLRQLDRRKNVAVVEVALLYYAAQHYPHLLKNNKPNP